MPGVSLAVVKTPAPPLPVVVRKPVLRGDYEREVVKLRDELDEAYATIAYLKDLVSPPGMMFPGRWRLSPQETNVLRALVAAPGVMSKDRLLVAIYDFEPEVEIKIVDVFVCKLRKKLAGEGIKIDTTWGVGYSLTPQMKAIVRDAADSVSKGLDWLSPLVAALRPAELERANAAERLGVPPAEIDVVFPMAAPRPRRNRSNEWAQQRQIVASRGSVIRRRRMALGLSQCDLAAVAKTYDNYVSVAENGRGWTKLLELLEQTLDAAESAKPQETSK